MCASANTNLRDGDMSAINPKTSICWLNGRLEYHKNRPDIDLAEARGYFSNGRLQFSYPVQNGLLHGICRLWFDSGILQSEQEYLRGQLNGFSRSWYSNGKMEAQSRYSRGALHGLSKHWDEHGKLISTKVYVRGREAPSEITELILDNKLNARHIIEIKNAELRRLCLEEIGYSRFLSQVRHQVVDKCGDQELVRIDWVKREEPILLVKVKCPSTGAYYTLRVPPSMKTVKEAVAWTFDLTKDDYVPVLET